MADYNEKRARENSEMVNDWRRRNAGSSTTKWVGRTLSAEEWADLERYDREHKFKKTTTSDDGLFDAIFERVFTWGAKGCCCLGIVVAVCVLLFIVAGVLYTRDL